MPVPCFLLFLVSEKLLRKYSRNCTKQKTIPLFSPEASRTPKRIRRRATRQPHLVVAWLLPWPRRDVVWGPQAPTDVALSPIYSPRRENPRYPIRNPRKVPEPPPSSSLVREGSEALPGILLERGIIAGGLYITMPASGLMRE